MTPNIYMPEGLTWRGGVIHINTTVGGRRIARSCHTKSVPEARRMLDLLKGQIHMAELTGIEAPAFQTQVNLAEFVRLELDKLTHDGAAKKTLTKYRGVMQVFIEFVGQKMARPPYVSDITHDLMQNFKIHATTTPRRRNGAAFGLGRPASPRTVANDLDVVRIFLRRAVLQKLLPTNPETGVTRARGAYAPRIRWLDDSETKRLLNAAATWDEWAHKSGQAVGSLYVTIIEFYLRTGLRLNELRHLPVSHCQSRDPSGRRIIHIGPHDGHTTFCCPLDEPVATQLKNQGRKTALQGLLPPEITTESLQQLQFLPTLQLAIMPISCVWKPKSSARDVPLSKRADELYEQLLQLRIELLRRNSAMAKARKQNHVSEPPWLIPDPSGVPWRFSMQYIMDRCSKQAGIHPIVRTHDLRHTFATQLRRRGVPIETIKELLGHADISETLIYAHFTMEEAVRSIDLIDEVGA